MKVHHITVSAFSDRAGAEGLKALLSSILPRGAHVEVALIEPETDGGVFLKEIVDVRSRLTKAADMKEFACKLFGGLDEYDRRKLAERTGDFVDDDCVLYVRLSKAEAAGGRLVMESRDPIHVSFKLAAYPARKENAVLAARELIESAVH